MRALKRLDALEVSSAPLPGLALAAALFSAGAPAWGAIQTLSTQAMGQSVQGSPDPASLLGQPRVSQFRQTLGYEVEGLARTVTLSTSVTTIQPDYSSFVVTARDGTSAPLSGDAGDGSASVRATELTASTGIGWDSGPHSASIGWAGHLTASPFQYQSVTASFSEGFDEKTTLLGVRAGMYAARQPVSHYVGADYVTRARPGLVHGNEIALTCDQVLSERIKAGLTLTTAAREEDRPRNAGVALSGAVAVSDRVFGRLALTRIGELRSQRLRDERGYFALSAAELGATYEPWIDLLITPSYAWVLEEESDPRTGRAVRVGSDQYGLALRYRGGAWELELKSQYRLTNTALRDLSLGGGVKWRI